VVTLWPGGGPTDRATRRAMEGYRTQLVGEEAGT
jgi:hypothetical protein